MADVEWTKAAANDLEKLDKNIATRIVKKITWLGKNFDTITPETLEGKFKGTYKYRVGDYRIIYTIERRTIVIQFIGHRREIYK